MADQYDIDKLVDQLRELVPALRGMSGTSTTGGGGSSRDMQRLIRAIATLATSMEKGSKNQARAIDDFIKGIDRAVDAQEQAAADIKKSSSDEAAARAESAERARLAARTVEEAAKEEAATRREAYRRALDAEYDKREATRNYARELVDLKARTLESKGVFGVLSEKIGASGTESEKFQRGIAAAQLTLKSLGTAAFATGKALYEGKQGASANNEALEGLGDAAEKLGAMFGPLGMIIGKIVKLFTGFAVEANKMSDRFYKTYQDLSRAGVAASDGMTGLAESAQRLGLGLDESGMQNFVRLLSAASEDIAMLSGSAIQGRKNFTEFSSSIVRGDVGRQLMNMGMSVEAINEGVAGYVKQQVSLGRAQTMSNQQLAAGAAAYLKEMDALTKLTGIQKQELENQMDSNRRNERFRAAIEKVRQEQGDEAAQALELNMAVASKRFPELAEGLKDIASGFVTTDAARKALQAGMADVPKQMTKGIGSGFQELGRAAKNTTQSMGGLAEVGAFGDVFGSYYEQLKAAGMSEQDAVKEAKKILEDRRRQEEGAGDAATAAQTNMRRQQMDSRDALQDFVKAGVAPATKAMEGFSSVTSKVVTALGGTVAGGMGGGGGGGLAAGGGATTGGGVSTAAAGGGGVFGAIGRGISRLAAGGIGGPVDPEKVIKFTGNTGTREHFDKLDPAVKDAFLQMAVEYNNMTGDKLQINSAFRTPGEQAAVDPGANPKAAPGMSLHNVGRAIDIQSNQKQALAGMGLLDRYGFKTLPNDPPHIFMNTGGVATGPRSGYAAMLHGTEAVVPLPDGKTIPVEMPNLDRNMQEQVSMMGAQLVALEELVRYMRDNNAINTKILQAANN